MQTNNKPSTARRAPLARRDRRHRARRRSPRPLLGCRSFKAEANNAPAVAAPRATPVSVATVAATEVNAWDEFSGRLEAVERVDVRSRVAGAVQAVHFREGALVKQGDLLVTIDPAPYAAEVERAEAQVAAAQARVASRAERAGARAAPVGRAAPSRSASSTSAPTRSARPRPTCAPRRRRCRRARLNLGYTQVRAPVAGPHRQARSHRRQPGRRRPRRAGADDAGVGEPDLRQLRRRRAGRRARAEGPARRRQRARAASSASRCRWAPPASDGTPLRRPPAADRQPGRRQERHGARARRLRQQGRRADPGPVRPHPHGPGAQPTRRCWSTSARSAPTRTRSS